MARLKSFWREPSVLFWSFGFPIVLAVALGIAFRNRPPEPVDVAVENTCTESVRNAITNDPALRGRVLPPGDAALALRTGTIALVVACTPEPSYHFDETRPE